MSKRVGAAAAVLVVSTGLAFAQASGTPPGPSAEHKRLGYFAGTWYSEVDMKANPFMPAGKGTSTDVCEWFEGGFTVICRSEGTSPMGPTKALAILGYSGEEKKYTYYGVDNSPMIMMAAARGTVQGGTWVYDDEAKMGGKTMKSRYTITEKSPTAYTFKWEMMGEDGAWKTLAEGTSTKK